MITHVFTSIGHIESIASATLKLMALNPTDPYAAQKAAGSLGGAVNGKFLERCGSYYRRIR